MKGDKSMSVQNLNFSRGTDYWITDPLVCQGSNVRFRVHKKGPYPVDVLVSIDGVEEYVKQEEFGLERLKSEYTSCGNMPGVHLKLSSRSELSLVKYLEA